MFARLLERGHLRLEHRGNRSNVYVYAVLDRGHLLEGSIRPCLLPRVLQRGDLRSQRGRFSNPLHVRGWLDRSRLQSGSDGSSGSGRRQ